MDRKGKRRPVRYWDTFNQWWRAELTRTTKRPLAEEINRWYALNAAAVWGGSKPTLPETRIHAKCLRSVDSVRLYFRAYRANKRGAGGSGDEDEDEDEDDDEDDDDDGDDAEMPSPLHTRSSSRVSASDQQRRAAPPSPAKQLQQRQSPAPMLGQQQRRVVAVCQPYHPPAAATPPPPPGRGPSAAHHGRGPPTPVFDALTAMAAVRTARFAAPPSLSSQQQQQLLGGAAPPAPPHQSRSPLPPPGGGWPKSPHFPNAYSAAVPAPPAGLSITPRGGSEPMMDFSWLADSPAAGQRVPMGDPFFHPDSDECWAGSGTPRFCSRGATPRSAAAFGEPTDFRDDITRALAALSPRAAEDFLMASPTGAGFSWFGQPAAGAAATGGGSGWSPASKLACGAAIDGGSSGGTRVSPGERVRSFSDGGGGVKRSRDSPGSDNKSCATEVGLAAGAGAGTQRSWQLGAVAVAALPAAVLPSPPLPARRPTPPPCPTEALQPQHRHAAQQQQQQHHDTVDAPWPPLQAPPCASPLFRLPPAGAPGVRAPLLQHPWQNQQPASSRPGGGVVAPRRPSFTSSMQPPLSARLSQSQSVTTTSSGGALASSSMTTAAACAMATLPTIARMAAPQWQQGGGGGGGGFDNGGGSGGGGGWSLEDEEQQISKIDWASLFGSTPRAPQGVPTGANQAFGGGDAGLGGGQQAFGGDSSSGASAPPPVLHSWGDSRWFGDGRISKGPTGAGAGYLPDFQAVVNSLSNQ